MLTGDPRKHDRCHPTHPTSVPPTTADCAGHPGVGDDPAASGVAFCTTLHSTSLWDTHPVPIGQGLSGDAEATPTMEHQAQPRDHSSRAGDGQRHSTRGRCRSPGGRTPAGGLSVSAIFSRPTAKVPPESPCFRAASASPKHHEDSNALGRAQAPHRPHCPQPAVLSFPSLYLLSLPPQDPT